MIRLLLLIFGGVITWRIFNYMLQDKQENIDLKARTAWGEARNQGSIGMQAVINTIDNRVKNARWWGGTVKEVILHPFQYSVWNKDQGGNYDMNGNMSANVTLSDKTFQEAVRLATLSEMGQLPDVTSGSTHYHADYVDPSWNKKLTYKKTIGDHIFYEEA